jgi:hypothetical protein
VSSGIVRVLEDIVQFRSTGVVLVLKHLVVGATCISAGITILEVDPLIY